MEDNSMVGEARARELLRRLVSALNDESGAVPYGVPEASGEILAVRAELRDAFLPIVCSLLTDDKMCQTGPIERGALWAVGRVVQAGAPVTEEFISAVARIVESYRDSASREAARSVLELVAHECTQ